mmetsp:Transcript_16146/g.54085  ORF Transcript_16146/g.54085 Transcript_16146/m.54085 type:complete len:161 (-) Transcript_16146:32-514(-)
MATMVQGDRGTTLLAHRHAFTPLSRSGQIRRRNMCAVAIPGDSVGEEVFVRGFQNFLTLYQNLLVARVLLSWFPSAQSIGALQPLYNVCDPYLNTFRGIIPPIGGIDLSPILAFTLLQVSAGAMVSLGAETPRRGYEGWARVPEQKVGICEAFVKRRFNL